jgi:hypothetical protein
MRSAYREFLGLGRSSDSQLAGFNSAATVVGREPSRAGVGFAIILVRGLPTCSIFFGKHDRDHPMGDRWISWIVGLPGKGRVVVIDLEKDCVAVSLEGTKVVLFARVFWVK